MARPHYEQKLSLNYDSLGAYCDGGRTGDVRRLRRQVGSRRGLQMVRNESPSAGTGAAQLPGG